jgi:hypothetical protein
MQRTGVIGWALMMWVIGGRARRDPRGSARVATGRLALVLWAIFSSGLGFLVSMSNFNAFYDADRCRSSSGASSASAWRSRRTERPRPGFNVIWRFGPGD